MSWYGRGRGLTLDDVLLRSRRNVYISLANGCHALVSVTVHLLAVHVYDGQIGRCDPDRSVTLFFAQLPHLRAIHDGQGWNVPLLLRLLRELTEPGAALAATRSTSEDEMSKRTEQRKLYLQQWRRSRMKPRDLWQGSCLVLRNETLRQVVPCLDADDVKRWLLAASHIDDLGRAHAGVRQFMAYGYRAENHKPAMKRLEAQGLIRYLREGERDRLTGQMMPDVYQCNPELAFIRKRNLEAALALSETPFADLLNPDPKPDPLFLSKPDQNQESTKIKNQESKTKNKNQSPPTNNKRQEGKNNSAARGNSPNGYTKNRKKAGSGDSSGKAASARSATRQNAPSPRSAPPPSPAPSQKIDLSPFSAALPDEHYEACAVELHQRTDGRMSHPWARYLVQTFGTLAVRAALAHYTRQQTSQIKNPAGYIRSVLERGAVDVRQFEAEQAKQRDYEELLAHNMKFVESWDVQGRYNAQAAAAQGVRWDDADGEAISSGVGT